MLDGAEASPPDPAWAGCAAMAAWSDGGRNDPAAAAPSAPPPSAKSRRRDMSVVKGASWFRWLQPGS